MICKTRSYLVEIFVFSSRDSHAPYSASCSLKLKKNNKCYEIEFILGISRPVTQTTLTDPDPPDHLDGIIIICKSLNRIVLKFFMRKTIHFRWCMCITNSVMQFTFTCKSIDIVFSTKMVTTSMFVLKKDLFYH